MPSFIAVAAIIGLVMLVWDCIEVGRNDAANLVNAVFGARVLKRRAAVVIAGAAVILVPRFHRRSWKQHARGFLIPLS